MGTVALIQNTTQHKERYLTQQGMPVRYMEDFTLAGLLVENSVDYKKAISLLSAWGGEVSVLEHGVDITITGPDSVQEIIGLLQNNNIHVTFSDIADTWYQA